MISVRVRGLGEIRRKLVVLTAAEKEAARLAVAASALRIQARAKGDAPVDTGRLRNSIATEQENLTARVGTNVDYAPHVEFGTRRMHAQPYLFPAAEEERDNFRREIARFLREGARRAV